MKQLLAACKKGEKPEMGRWGSLPLNGQVSCEGERARKKERERDRERGRKSCRCMCMPCNNNPRKFRRPTLALYLRIPSPDKLFTFDRPSGHFGFVPFIIEGPTIEYEYTAAVVQYIFLLTPTNNKKHSRCIAVSHGTPSSLFFAFHPTGRHKHRPMTVLLCWLLFF